MTKRLRDLRHLSHDRLAFFSGCVRTDGAAVRCRVLGTAFVLNAPDDVKHVLVGGHRNYVKGRRLVAVRSGWRSTTALITSSGVEHQRRRRALQPIFRQALIERLTERARVNATNFVELQQNGEAVDAGPAMGRLVERNILETLFGALPDASMRELSRSSRARSRFIESVYFSLFPFPEYIPRRVNLHYALALRSLDRVLAAELAARRRGAPGGDMLSKLMQARDHRGQPLSERDLRDEILTFSLTGYESVGEALAWTLFLLAREPAAMTAAIDELRTASQSEAWSGAPARAAPYTTRVILEAMRLFPPTWVLVRRAIAPHVLPGGTRIPADGQVWISPWVLHRNPGLWPDPERFDPARFLESTARQRPRYAYLPFGGGPHACIGESLAMSEILTVLAAITARHRPVLDPSGSPAAEPGITLRPRCLLLRFERDRPAAST